MLGHIDQIRSGGPGLGVLDHVVSNLVLEAGRVLVVVLGGRMVQRIFEVQQIGEQRIETPDDVLDCSGRRPAHAVDRALAQQAQAYVALLAYVRMPDSGEALDFRRREIVFQWHFDVEFERSVAPVALLRFDLKMDLVQLAGVRKAQLASGRQIGLDLLDFCKRSTGKRKRELAVSRANLGAARSHRNRSISPQRTHL